MLLIIGPFGKLMTKPMKLWKVVLLLLIGRLGWIASKGLRVGFVA
jgi:hypothetical protein